MPHAHPLALMISALVLLALGACSARVANQPPTVTLSTPLDGTTVPLGNPLTVEAEASDPDGSVSHVTFNIDGQELAVAAPPYRYAFTPTEARAYTLSATAYDDRGASSAPASATVEAQAAPSLFSVTLALAGAGSGTVTSEPPGLECPASCSAEFPVGETVTLTAKAEAGSSFSGWGGACASANGARCTLGAAEATILEVEASFEQDESAEISVSLSPESAILAPGEALEFTATVTGSDAGVRWSAAGGSVAGDALVATYTAPSEPGDYTLSATSVEDESASASATITVEPGVEPGNDPFTVVAAGDIACGDSSPQGPEYCHDRETADLVTAIDPDLVLVLGDNQYDPSTYDDFMTYYDKTWGAFKAITRPALGNHEYDAPTPNAEGYFQYFGAAAGEPGKGYYSFDAGDWHIVVLNTNDDDCGIVDCRAGSAQEQWLRDDLAKSDKRCTLAVMHHPRYNSGNHGNAVVTQDLWKALYDASADVVLVGHAHHYERFAPQDHSGKRDDERGLVEFLVGTGGKSLEETYSPISNSEKIIEGVYGVLELTLREDGYDWRFVPEAGSSGSDAGSATCH